MERGGRGPEGPCLVHGNPYEAQQASSGRAFVGHSDRLHGGQKRAEEARRDQGLRPKSTHGQGCPGLESRSEQAGRRGLGHRDPRAGQPRARGRPLLQDTHPRDLRAARSCNQNAAEDGTQREPVSQLPPAPPRGRSLPAQLEFAVGVAARAPPPKHILTECLQTGCPGRASKCTFFLYFLFFFNIFYKKRFYTSNIYMDFYNHSM